ncbi:uncharacterized protein DS421_4g114200 [Arachis hypogaea]|nr:uncharacterized protein DS421_4g114200 [Arachis hypogaea]
MERRESVPAREREIAAATVDHACRLASAPPRLAVEPIFAATTVTEKRRRRRAELAPRRCRPWGLELRRRPWTQARERRSQRREPHPVPEAAAPGLVGEAMAAVIGTEGERKIESSRTAEVLAITIVEEAHRSCWRLSPLCLVVLSRAAVPGRRKNPLQSPKNSAGAIAGVPSLLLLEVAAGLLPNRSGNRRCSSSAVPSYLRVDVVTAKVSKAVVQAAGDFGMRRKGLCETFGLWICVLR